jgi:hypothetical protein
VLAVIAIMAVTVGSVPVAGRTHAAGACKRLSAGSVRSARSVTPRDRDALSPRQVRGMLDDLRRTLVARFGTADERSLRLGVRPVIPVWFHVITDGRAGTLTRAAVDWQIWVLNAAYGGRTGGADTGVSFRLTGIDRTTNARWFAAPERHERRMMTALRRGGRSTLNLYSAAVGIDVLGFSSFPQWSRGRHRAQDGVVIDYRSLPWSGTGHFNRGYTAVHEVGHWLGLLHTFENGCASPGDGIDDTPYEAEATEACPRLKDTCMASGSDPVHNFMDYGYDDCMSQFTPGQARRIRAAWAAYRA